MIIQQESFIDEFRPRYLDEIVGQKKRLLSVSNSLRRGRLPRLLIFSGNTGIGKTSAARCLAFALGCKNFDYKTLRHCGECYSCKSSLSKYEYFNCAEPLSVKSLLNIIASNSVSRNSAFLLLDEVDALPPKVQTILLTVLERGRTRYIFATTNEPKKLLTKFTERFRHIKLTNPSVKDVLKRLKFINKAKRCGLSEGELRTIAVDNCGSVRNAIQALEKAAYEKGLM